MGAEGSKCKAPSPSLAEKRYKVERVTPKKKTSISGASSSKASTAGVCQKKRSTSLVTNNNTLTKNNNTEEKSRLPREVSCPVINEHKESDRSESATVSVSGSQKERKHFLSKRERMLIDVSWKKTKKTGADAVGSKIFLMVLTAQPDIKAIFGLEKIPQGRLKYDPRFRQHAQVFTKSFEYVIKNLDYPEKIEQHFEALGNRHVALQGRGFRPQYWETFAECMTQTAVEWEAHRQRPTTSAWRNLVSQIIGFMRHGFDEENTRRRLNSVTVSHHHHPHHRARRSSHVPPPPPRPATTLTRKADSVHHYPLYMIQQQHCSVSPCSAPCSAACSLLPHTPSQHSLAEYGYPHVYGRTYSARCPM